MEELSFINCGSDEFSAMECFERPQTESLVEVKAEQPDDVFKDALDKDESFTIKEEIDEQEAYLKQEIEENEDITIDENVTTSIVPNVKSESPSTSKHEDLRDVVKKVTLDANGQSSGTHSKEKSYFFISDQSTQKNHQINLTPQMLFHSVQQVYACEVAFEHEGKLKEHNMVVHTGLKAYACETCGSPFMHRLDMKKHMLYHSDERSHTCKTCNKGFRQIGKLKRHILVHTGDKQHACEVCGRSFGQKSYLAKHIKAVHSGTNEYVCDKCKRAFTEKGTLKHHVLKTCPVFKYVEADKRAHTCKTCNRQVYNLKKHMLVHTGDKPYACEVCNRSFGQKSHFIRHILVHSGKKDYVCDKCKRAFAVKCTLKKHVLNTCPVLKYVEEN